MDRPRTFFRRLTPPGSAPGWIVFAGALLVLLVFQAREERRLRQFEEERFNAFADRSAGYLQQRLDTYEETLRGFAGFFAGSQKVEAGEFAAYCRSIDPLRRLPGFLSVAYAPRVIDGRVAPGSPAMTLWTDEPALTRHEVPPAGEHYAYLYRCPASPDMIGYDLSRTPAFSDAIERARETGEPSASRPVALGDPRARRFAILLVLPIWKGGPRPGESPPGMVTLAIGTREFFANIIDPELYETADLEIDLSDGPRDRPVRIFDHDLADSAALASLEKRPVRVRTVSAAGLSWSVRYLARDAGLRSGRRALALQLWIGLALCLALGLLVGALSVDRRRLELERDRLAQSEAERGALLARVTDGFVAVDRDWRYTHVNARAGELYGRDPAALIGRSLWSEFPEGFGREFPAACEAALASQQPQRVEVRDAARDRWFENRIYPSANGVTIFLTEITARKRTERAAAAAREAHERRGALLLEIARSPALRDGDLLAVYRRIVAAAAEGLGVERAGLWFFNADRTTLVCESLHDSRGRRDGEGALLEAARYPAYFAAIGESLVVDAADACADARTRELAEDYLRPEGIGALLDVPLRRGGETVGVLCVEPVLPRAWAGEEAIFATALAELAGNALETAERRIAERALAEREAHYRDIFDFAPIGIYQTSRDGRVMIANRALAALLGYAAPGDLVGLDMARDLYHDAGERDRLIERWESQGAAARLEVRFKRRDGSPVWVQLDAHAVKGADGRTRYYEGFIHDIADRKRAEEELRRTADELRLIMDALPDLFFRIDSGGRIVSYHASQPADLLLPPEQFHNRRMVDVLPAPLADQYRATIEAASTGIQTAFEYELDLPAGRQHFEARLVPLPGGEVLVIARNNTDRYRAVEALRRLTEELEMRVEARTRELAAANAVLRERTDLLTAVTEGTPDAIYVKDREGIYRFINSAGARFLGSTPAGVIGRPDDRFMDAESARGLKRMDANILESSAPQTFDDVIVVAGARRVMYTTKGTLRDAEGRVSGLFGISRDITERRRQEAALERLNGELRERNAELQRLNADLEAFAGTVAHDLRAPLQTILGFTDALRGERGARLGRDGEAYVGRIEAAVARMTDLLDGLLTLARASRAEMRTQAVDLAALARELLAELAVRDPGRRVAVEIPDSLPARGDPAQLRVLLANLLGNAWKFTARTPDAELRMGERREGGERIFFVRDNGAGFDPARAGRLFKPFQRLHASGEFPGTGVGLATAARIVARHGGRLWAESRPGEGATFLFTLPDAP